jgi:hypothetical protein
MIGRQPRDLARAANVDRFWTRALLFSFCFLFGWARAGASSERGRRGRPKAYKKPGKKASPCGLATRRTSQCQRPKLNLASCRDSVSVTQC